jgi:hypothetical protein
MKRHVKGSIAVGMCLVIALVASTAVPSYAQRSGGGGSRGGGAMSGGGAHNGGSHVGGGSWQRGGGGTWHGGGGSWHGGGGSWNGGWRGGSWNGGWRGGGWGWRGGSWGWWGPGFVVGAALAAPYWGYPYGYPYPYANPYPYGYPAYSPPVIGESSPQTYLQQDIQAQQPWFYCQDPQGYYPYVRECPGGWQPVSPQPPSPPR